MGVLGGIGSVYFIEYLRGIMASRVVSLWMTNSVFIKQWSDIKFKKWVLVDY